MQRNRESHTETSVSRAAQRSVRTEARAEILGVSERELEAGSCSANRWGWGWGWKMGQG